VVLLLQRNIRVVEGRGKGGGGKRGERGGKGGSISNFQFYTFTTKGAYHL